MFTIQSDLLTKAGLTAQDADALLAGTGLAGLGADFLAAEKSYGINAYFIMAHAIIESAWGNSWFAVNRNNLFGLDAYDSNPMDASSYASKAACIDYYGHFLKTYYLTAGAVYYNGATPHGVFVEYSTSHDTEANAVVGVMNQLESKEAKSPALKAPAPAPRVGSVSSRTYTLRPGDTMTGVADKYGLTLVRLEQLNPHAGHPAGDFNVLWPGDVLNVAGANPPSVATIASQPVYISVPSGYQGYLSVIAAKYHTTVAQLVAWNKAAHPTMTENFVEAGWRLKVA